METNRRNYSEVEISLTVVTPSCRSEVLFMTQFIELEELPQELIAAIETDHYTDPTDKPSDYSATKLISPIQKTELARRYKDTDKLIESDVLDRFPAWVGSIIHNSIQDAWKKSMGSIVEERFYMTFMDKVVSGKVDCLSGNTIIDWKTCRVYKVLKGDTEDWEKQANIYALLAENSGYEVKDLRIYAIILDLTKNESYKQDMPKKPVVMFKLNRWTNEEIKQYIKQRVIWLEEAKKLTDEQLAEEFPCSRKEQWSGIQDYAVVPKKEGYSRATKVFKEYEGIEAAEQWLLESKHTDETHEVITRYKKRTRCLEYCECKNICKQFQAENNIQTGLK